MKSKIQGLLLAAALFFFASAANANIIYQVNRVIGAGTLTGYIETNGALGAIGTGDFVDWSLTLTAPDINGGAPSTIIDGSNNFFLLGSGLSATSTDLLFDFSTSSLFFAFTSSNDFWCLAGGSAVGCFAQGEIIGYSDVTGAQAYIQPLSGVQSFASTAVPLPASWALVGIALGLLAAHRRRA